MNKILQWIYKKRAKYYSNKIIPIIKKNETVLDIGAGSGYLAELINQKAKVTLIDIVDYNQTKLPLILYDSKKLPFEDNSFDTGLIVAVLHHTSNPENFLQESKRVCKRLIIIEEIYSSILSRLFLDIWEWFWNKTSGITTFYNFHSNKEWKEIFSNLNLRLMSNEELKNSLNLPKNLIRMNMFILEK